MTDHPTHGILPRFIPIVGHIGGDAARTEAPAAPLLRLGPGGEYTRQVAECKECRQIVEVNSTGRCHACIDKLFQVEVREFESEAPWGRCQREGGQCGYPLLESGLCPVHSSRSMRENASEGAD
jgi:hypothetical protein